MDLPRTSLSGVCDVGGVGTVSSSLLGMVVASTPGLENPLSLLWWACSYLLRQKNPFFPLNSHSPNFIYFQDTYGCAFPLLLFDFVSEPPFLVEGLDFGEKFLEAACVQGT